MSQDSLLLKYKKDRKVEFQSNPKLDALINRLKFLLEPIQALENRKYIAPKHPIVLILGLSRTGTTLLTQILAASNKFAYPTNFLSRFAYAPLIGALIQEMIFNPEYDFRGELSDIQSAIDFESDLGKTSNALGISEFFHFWRKFFPNYEPSHLVDNELELVDVNRMRSEIASIESVFDKPFMSKGKMLQFNVNFFLQRIPEILFIHIKRQPRYVMQSILQSRRRYYGRDDIWWSVKPKEYEWLSSMDHFYQIAGQVLFTKKEIDEQLAEVEENRKIICHYEDLCANPQGLYNELQKKVKEQGYNLDTYYFDESFTPGNSIRIDKNEIYQLEKAYDDLSSCLNDGEV